MKTLETGDVKGLHPYTLTQFGPSTQHTLKNEITAALPAAELHVNCISTRALKEKAESTVELHSCISTRALNEKAESTVERHRRHWHECQEL